MTGLANGDLSNSDVVFGPPEDVVNAGWTCRYVEEHSLAPVTPRNLDAKAARHAPIVSTDGVDPSRIFDVILVTPFAERNSRGIV